MSKRPELRQTPPAIIPGYILQNENISRPQKLLIGLINTLSNNEKGYCTAKNATLANWCGVPKGTISPWLAELANKGYIKREIIKEEKTFKERHLWLPESKEIANKDTPLENQEGGLEKSSDPSLGNSRPNKQESNKESNKQDSSTTNVVESEDSQDENLKEMHQQPPDKEYDEWTKGDIVKNYFYWQYQITEIPKQPSNWGQAKKLAGDLLDKFSPKTIDGATQYFWRLKSPRFRDKFNTPIGDIHNVVGEYQEWAKERRKQHEKEKERQEIEQEIEKEIKEEGIPEYKSVNLGGVLSGNSN